MATMDHLAMEFPLDHPLKAILDDAVQQVSGKKPEVGCFPGWTDAALLSNQGKTPTVVLGPGSMEQAHAAVEFCPADEIVQAAKIYALAAAGFCGLLT
ncbi:MAG: acetylornithine deacetylase [Synergistetes bacterium ADurb.Bin520]|nr:MAG: acetylornithine deacetylase [Synergistetes bacterium ADurb.Bin520]